MSERDEVVGTAHRVKYHEAKRAFENGRTILLSEYGREATQRVGRMTTTHTNKSITWAELDEDRKMWSGRYPNQRYYIVEMTA